MTPAQRFWERVSMTDGCWLWTGPPSGPYGYGRLNIKGHAVMAHRFSWELHIGTIPPRMCVLHRCDVGLCVRPDHLFLGTKADNCRDRSAKGRTASADRNGARTRPDRLHCGEDNCNAKLTAEQVQAIKSSYVPGTVTQRALAAEYGVSHTLIGLIIRERAWKHLESPELYSPPAPSVNSSRPRRAHCLRGHPYTPENIIWDHSRGFSSRTCRLCHQEACRRYRANKKEQASKLHGEEAVGQ